MDRDSWVLALFFGIIGFAWGACLVTLALGQRDLRRAEVNIYSASFRFVLRVLLFLVPADAAVLLVSLSLNLGEGTASLATALMALLVITLVYRWQRRQLQPSTHLPKR